MGARHNSPRALRTQRLLGTVTENSRRAWTLTQVAENGRLVVVMTLCRRAPSGALTPTRHRSVLRDETARAIAAVILAEEGH